MTAGKVNILIYVDSYDAIYAYIAVSDQQEKALFVLAKYVFYILRAYSHRQSRSRPSRGSRERSLPSPRLWRRFQRLSLLKTKVGMWRIISMIGNQNFGA